MWRLEHPDVALQDVPIDMVTTSASGLEPHIIILSAELELDRVASNLAADIKQDAAHVRAEIEALLQRRAFAPFDGPAGEEMVNVL